MPQSPETSAITIRRIQKMDSSWLQRVIRTDDFTMFVVTVALVLLASTIPHFLDGGNLLSIAQQIAIVSIVAVGMTFVIVVGEIDLSVGSMYGLLAVLFAWMVRIEGIPAGPAIVLVLVAGTAIGVLNGIVTTIFGIPSFVVTLAGLAIFRGAALLISGGTPITGSRDPFFTAITAGQPLPGLSAQTIWMVAIAVVLGIVLALTRFGANVYSVGGNSVAAANAGVPVVITKIACFALVGFLCGVAALLLTGWLGSANPLTGQGFELDVIAAVVVGGAVLTGGKGTVLGTLFGAIIAGILSNALVLNGVDGNWRQVATGALILVAVMINRYLRPALTVIRGIPRLPARS